MNYLSALEQATVQLSTSYTAAEAANSLLTLFLAEAALHAIVTFRRHANALASAGFRRQIRDGLLSREDLRNNERRS